MQVNETIVNIEGKSVTRIRSSLFYIGGVGALLVGVLLALNKLYVGLTLILVVAPFFFMYPLIRALMLGKDSIGAVLVTAYLDYWLNKKIRGNRQIEGRDR